MIEIRDLTFRYGDGTAALTDVNVSFPSGEAQAILGESGSGKTTLLMCLGRFLRPAEGQILMDGRDIFSFDEREFRRRLGIVFQKLYLFPHLTVLQNLELALVHVTGEGRAAARRRSREMLQRLGISEIEDSYPAQISGGQAQRVAIARGLVLRPEYMLLDEPTSALDANTTDEFAAWLREIRDQTSFIVVTHDLLFADKVASHGVYLSGGQVLSRDEVGKIIRHVRAGQVLEPTTGKDE